MKALDTNILIRFLVRDDSSMTDRVDQLLEAAHTRGSAFLVSLPAVLEIVWVLKSGYKLARADILDAIEKLSLMPVLTFDPTCLGWLADGPGGCRFATRETGAEGHIGGEVNAVTLMEGHGGRGVAG